VDDMAHDTKTLLRDGSGITPVPQFFNPTADDFRPLTGVDLGNGRYGADGLIWGKTSGGVYVPVKCNADGAVVTELSGSIPAGTNNIGDVDLASAIPAGSAIIGKVGIDQTTPGTTNKVVAELSGSIPAGANEIGKVQLSGSKMELYGATVATRPAATAVAIGTTFTIIDSTGNFDSWISDGMNWREV